MSNSISGAVRNMGIQQTSPKTATCTEDLKPWLESVFPQFPCHLGRLSLLTSTCKILFIYQDPNLNLVCKMCKKATMIKN